jgi:hypothetical protein
MWPTLLMGQPGYVSRCGSKISLIELIAREQMFPHSKALFTGVWLLSLCADRETAPPSK